MGAIAGDPRKKRAESGRRKRVTADTTGVTHLMGSPSGLVSAARWPACSRHSGRHAGRLDEDDEDDDEDNRE